MGGSGGTSARVETRGDRGMRVRPSLWAVLLGVVFVAAMVETAQDMCALHARLRLEERRAEAARLHDEGGGCR